MKFKDILCAYCGEQLSTKTGDHIFARAFFVNDISRRGDLPKAPACDKCNNEKSQLEQYLTLILPFGGRHPDAQDNLELQVPPRLKKNRQQHSSLKNEMNDIYVKENGLYVRTTALPLNVDKLFELIKYAVKGLMWHHWKIYLDSRCRIEVMGVDSAFREACGCFLTSEQQCQVTNNLGQGTVRYKGIKGLDNDNLSISFP